MQDRDGKPLSDTVGQAGLIELDRRTCLTLLGTAVIGRVIYTDAALPAAHPVSFMLDGEEIVFRTQGGAKLQAAIRNTVVGFQVDELDLAARTGWTVLGVGEAYEITEPRRLAALRERLPRPWPSGRIEYTIAVPLQRLTGRRITTGAPGADEMTDVQA